MHDLAGLLGVAGSRSSQIRGNRGLSLGECGECKSLMKLDIALTGRKAEWVTQMWISDQTGYMEMHRFTRLLQGVSIPIHIS